MDEEQLASPQFKPSALQTSKDGHFQSSPQDEIDKIAYQLRPLGESQEEQEEGDQEQNKFNTVLSDTPALSDVSPAEQPAGGGDEKEEEEGAEGEIREIASEKGGPALTDTELKVYSMPRQYRGVKERKGEAQAKKRADLSNKKFVFILLPLILLLAGGAAAAYFLIVGPVLNQQKSVQTEPLEPIGVSSVESTPPTEAPPAEPISETEEEEVVIPAPPPAEEPPVEEITPPKPESVLGQDLVQKVAVSYDEQGNKTTEAVLSLEKEAGVNFSFITIIDHIIEQKEEYFSLVAGQPYEIKFRGQNPSARAVLSITYTPELLARLDLIPADLRIGYLSFDKLAEQFYASDDEAAPAIWQILKAQDLDDEVNSVSSVIDEIKEGIYAIVPIDVNKMIELPPPPAAEEPTPSGEIIKALDTDGDLLTDQEELLYGTSPLVLDSDSDGYGDGDEVLSLYSPARGAGVALEEDLQFTRWQNSEFSYSVLIPSSFNISSVVPESSRDVILKAPNNESILISLQEKETELTLAEWLLAISPDLDLSNFEKFITKSGFVGLVADKQNIYYLEVPQSQYVFVFSGMAEKEYSYLTTLKMIVTSLEYNVL